MTESPTGVAGDRAPSGTARPGGPSASSGNVRQPDRDDAQQYRWWRLWALGVLVAWIAVSAAAITTSSVGIFGADERASGVLVGSPNPLRADEYARGSPLWMGLEASGGTEFISPLTNDPFLVVAIPSGSAIEYALFPERGLLSAGPLLPDEPLFALVFWLPVAVCLILLPYVLIGWGAPLGAAIVASVLVAISPATVWWSWGSLFSLVPALVAAAALTAGARLASRSGWAIPTFLVAVGGLAAARAPWSYPPWSLVLLIGLFGITLTTLVAKREHLRRVLAVALGIVVVAAVATVVLLFLQRREFTVLSGTVYPGQRQYSGTALPWSRVFTAPAQGVLKDNPPVYGSNLSEISATWNVAIVAWLVLVLASWRSLRAWQRWQVVAAAAVIGVCYSWMLVDWPRELGTSLPLLNLVSPARMAVTGGIFTIAASAALIGRRRLSWLWAVVGAAVAGAITLVSAQEMVTSLVPSMTNLNALNATLWTTLVVGLVLTSPRWSRALGYTGAVVGALVIVYGVAPVQQGLGPLRHSEAAAVVRAIQSQSGPGESGYWGADSPAVSSLLTANGIPALSGDMWSGPSQKWLILDPTERYKEYWNRGATNVEFVWDPAATEPIIELPTPDAVTVVVSPCDPALDRLDLKYVVSLATPLQADCLTQVATATWTQRTVYIYSRAATAS